MRAFAVICIICSWLVPTVGIAQFTLPGDNPQLLIEPAFPAPGTTAQVTLNDFTFDTTGATINWLIDGESPADSINKRAISVPVGSAGTATEVQVALRLRDGQIITATETIIPSSLALTLEAETYTPAWYLGRAVPSAGSDVRVIAIPNIGSQTLNPDQYSYIWRLNNTVLTGGAIQGGYIQTITMPRNRAAVLEVTAAEPTTGRTIARSSVLIPVEKPQLSFYEVNPLRGMSRLALPDTTQLIGSEITIQAEPYFMSSAVTTEQLLQEWTVNGRVTENPNDNQRTLTLQNGGGTGAFNISFHIRNLEQLLQGIEDSFIIQF